MYIRTDAHRHCGVMSDAPSTRPSCTVRRPARCGFELRVDAGELLATSCTTSTRLERHEHQGGELFDVELYERGPLSPSRASMSRSGSGSVSGP
jgi:hypothetical protein